RHICSTSGSFVTLLYLASLWKTIQTLSQAPLPTPSALWDSGTIKYILSPRKIRSPRREGMKMADAKQKRNEQLKRWLGSETDIEPPILKKKKTKVKFDDGAVFLAACSSGDTEEVLRMIDRGADINYANVDGLTALHQACIDDNVDMVTFLVEHGAAINQPDNEGWIPLHAAASCGYMDIAEYLIGQGASVGVVNSEGETPLDIAEEEAMEELLKNEINRQGVDIEAARKEEERIMLRDARQWLNSGTINDVRHAKSGGTALHVAAAKGYAEVLKLLIQAGYDVNIKDFDGWTPLHAASHWGKEEACKILVENLCDMDLINKVGQTAFDVADEDVLGYLEELQKKQNLLNSEKKDVKKSPLIETTTTGDNNQNLKSIKSKETLLLEPEKPAPRIETLEPEKVDEEEEGKKDQESSCSSEEEEEEDSESETEAGMFNLLQWYNEVSPKDKPEDDKTKKSDESPASWRLGLRKTGSYGALAEITATKEAQKEKDTTGVMRSASSPRLSSSLDNKDKEKEKDKGTRLAYVAPTIPRRLASTSDIDEKENRDSAASLVRSGSYTRRRWDDELKNSEGSASTNRTTPSYQRSTSHTLTLGRSGSTRDVPAKSSSASSLDSITCNTKPWQSPTSHYQSYSIYRSPVCTIVWVRYWAEESAEREKEREKESAAVIPTINTASTTTTTSTTGTIIGSDGRERRRSDTHSLNSVSSQGVTLTDLQEAEKTIGRSRPTRTREEEKEEKEKQDKEKQEEKETGETKEDDYRSRYRSFEEVCDGFPKSYLRCSLIHLEIQHEFTVDPSVHVFILLFRNESSTSSSDRYDHLGSRGYGEGRRSFSSRLDRDDSTDYKKLYEQILAENEKLKSQLRDTDLQLNDLKLQLEKATQVRHWGQERRALERKISEMEEELKTLPDLKADNQRLKDENGALIRVISKLSK
uniref:Protein phosphatase 1 regulatory subunit n=2 Tax=Salmo trutta TaxID=8032 RepID=A0A674BF52_SALTR